MTITKASPTATVRLRKIFSAKVERVYKAWTEPAQMMNWFGCDRVTGLEINQDFKVGGAYHIVMNCGEVSMNVTGKFEEIVPNKKLVYTWASDFPENATTDSLVSVQFIEKGDSTEVVLDHTRFDSDKAAEGHNEGWSYALESLAKLFD